MVIETDFVIKAHPMTIDSVGSHLAVLSGLPASSVSVASYARSCIKLMSKAAMTAREECIASVNLAVRADA